jgi:hypothetical protein
MAAIMALIKQSRRVVIEDSSPHSLERFGASSRYFGWQSQTSEDGTCQAGKCQSHSSSSPITKLGSALLRTGIAPKLITQVAYNLSRGTQLPKKAVPIRTGDFTSGVRNDFIYRVNRI